MKLFSFKTLFISVFLFLCSPAYGLYSYNLALDSDWVYDEESCKKGFSKKEFLSVFQNRELLDLDVFFSLKTPTPNSQWMIGLVAWDESVDYGLPFHIEKVFVVAHSKALGSSEVLYEEEFRQFITIFPGQEFKFHMKAPKEKPSVLEVRLWGGFQ